jgi:glycosyltransferase involved in cell wall biosynthesis
VKRLLTIGHSYVVAQNRRLAHEIALAGQGRWCVTAAGPAEYRGDLRQIVLERFDGEASEVVPLRTRTVGVPHLMLYRGLRRLMSQHWDVVHCWEEPYVAAAAQIARRAPASAAFVFATFQNIVKDYPFPLAAFERQVLARADGWIAFGKTARETQLTRDVRYAELPSRTISPGVDTAAFVPSAALRAEARATLGWKPDALVVGFVGRFVPEKGIRLLLDALSRQQVRWSALFVGNGPERPRIDAFGRDWPGRVRIVADASHDDVPRWLNAMDVMCAPSQTTVRWREQFGRMLVEAMACGVPVIASDSGEIPNVVGDAAIVVPEHTVEQWAAAIDRLLGDADARRHYGEHGRARVNERFAWPIAASQHVQFFEELS